MKDLFRLHDRLRHMADSIDSACSYVKGLEKPDFLEDFGEAATQISST